MFDINRPIPWSGRRYFLNGIGELTNQKGEFIETFERNGERFVVLEWLLGQREYSVAVLVLVTFGLVQIPDHLLDEIIPLYKDGSATNLSPSNLLYKFKSGSLQVENFPGFYYIPFYNEYAINIKGELINIKTGKYKSWSITKPIPEKNQTGGYLYSRVVNELGFSKTLFQHRALCYVFKSYGHDIEELAVNHIDGNPGNNNLMNLEFVTYQRNNVHAVENGLRGDNRPVLSRDLQTGEILRFNSIGACGRHYGQPRAGFVVHRLNYNRDKLYSDMLQFKFDDGTPWPEIDLVHSKIHRVGRAEDIAARNVFTGDIVIFEGAPNGYSYTGVKAATILSHVREDKLIPVNGWNFRWLSENIVWPSHTEKHLKVYAKYPIYPPDGVTLINVETNDEQFFESVALACQVLKINKRLLYSAADTDKLICNKYRVCLFKLREHLGHPAEKSV